VQTTTTTTPSNIKELNVFNLFSFQQHSATVVGIFVFVCVRWGGGGCLGFVCLFVCLFFGLNGNQLLRRGAALPDLMSCLSLEHTVAAHFMNPPLEEDSVATVATASAAKDFAAGITAVLGLGGGQKKVAPVWGAAPRSQGDVAEFFKPQEGRAPLAW
jgi:hypothetical protein